MPNDINYLIFKCLNQDCALPVKLHRPAKSGVYPVTCPHCGLTKNMRLKGLDSFDTYEAQPEPKAQELDNSNLPPIIMSEDFITGQLYRFMCPHCGIQELGLNSPKAGQCEFACPKCKGKIKADVRDKTQVLDLSPDTVQLLRGKLTLLKRGWFNQSYPLKMGKQTIGRYDESDMSDISIKNDTSISRKSLEIEVSYTDKGYVYKLRVLKATNPVLHNNSPLMPGETVSLNFGDSIVMGKTKFRFDKDV